MDYNELSDEAKEVVKAMVDHCIHQSIRMGQDEGCETWDEDGEPIKKHQFRIELEKFCGISES